MKYKRFDKTIVVRIDRGENVFPMVAPGAPLDVTPEGLRQGGVSLQTMALYVGGSPKLADIRTAFACNALFPVYGAYCGWLTVSTARQYIRTGKATLPARPVAVHIILLVLALGYGVLRNTL